MKNRLYWLIALLTAVTLGLNAKPSPVDKDTILSLGNHGQEIASVEPYTANTDDNDGDNDEDNKSEFMKGVLPPTPQAAALTRYAEFPVDYSTGVPSISVPIYEINIGGFTLPISLSYHASGIKVEDMSGVVGLGWVLNAGGVISRNVRGTADFETTQEDRAYKYRNYDNFKSMVEGAKVAGTNTNIIDEITDMGTLSSFDSASDRYTFNFGNHSGVFVYSHEQKRFISLNLEPLSIRYIDNDRDGAFEIVDGEGIIYLFGQPEHTGFRDDEGNTKVSAWYLTEIVTPTGKIKLEYKAGTPYNTRRHSSLVTVGLEYNYEDDMFTTVLTQPSTSSVSTSYYTNREMRLGKISWEQNSIEFTYGSGVPYYNTLENSDINLDRLVSIKVFNREGTLRKQVVLDNEHYWGFDSRNKRMLLTGVTDTDEGTYTFEYNTSNRQLPPFAEAPYTTDYWGYFNGIKDNPKPTFTVSQDIARLIGDKYRLSGRIDIERYTDRQPDPEKCPFGILTSVTFPTGATTSLVYESNDGVINDPLPRTVVMGGLRVKSMTTRVGNAISSTEYEYSVGERNYPYPTEMMCYHFISYFNGKTGALLWLDQDIFLSDPVMPSTGGYGAPVFYSSVICKNSDGTSKEYRYTRGQVQDNDSRYLWEPWNVDRLMHYSLNPAETFDEGTNQALIESVLYYDKTGKTVYEEKYEYETLQSNRFETGITVFRNTNQLNNQYHQPDYSIVYSPENFNYRRCVAVAKSCQLKNKTVTDLVTGYTTVEQYSYDDALRTLLPRQVATKASDGVMTISTNQFAFDNTDPVSKDMIDNFNMYNAITGVTVKHGSTVVSRRLVQYSLLKNTAWGINSYLPSRILAGIGNGQLHEVERITAFNNHGRPLEIITNESDKVTLTWAANGLDLVSSISPGGYKTDYSIKPLFGLISVKNQRGDISKYTYHPDGRLASVADREGIIQSYTYNISSRDKKDGNYVTTRRYLDNNATISVDSRQYYDGLGRPTQTSVAGMNTTGEVVNTLTVYDNMGREARRYQPVAVGSSIVEYSETDIAAALKSQTGDDALMSDIRYDALGRVISTTAPGAAWRDNDRKVTVEYVSNDSAEVKLYTAPVGNTSLVKSGFYRQKTLTGEKTTDEDGVTVTVFKDRDGRKVLERRGNDNDTYFVYNDYGQLRFVLQPQYQHSGYRDQYAFEYRYDDYGNLVKKIVPGAETVQYWYDRAGRMTFMQDATLRVQGLYRFMLYDAEGRLAVQGTCRDCNRSNAVNPVTFNVTGGIGGTGYSLADESRLSHPDVEAAFYFDNYDFLELWDGLGRNLAIDWGRDATTLPTGSMNVASDGTRLLSVQYYNLRGDIQCTRATHPIPGRVLVTTATHNFLRQPIVVRKFDGEFDITTTSRYDAQTGLLTATDILVKNDSCRVETLAYDNLGRVTSRTLGGNAGRVDYTFTPTGRLSTITGPGFTQSLYYNDGPGTPRWNGSISAMTWTMQGDKRLHGYRYTYDYLNRLNLAQYGKGASLTGDINHYTEEVKEYTANGAMKRFQRHGLKDDDIFGKVDNLHIYLDGNQLSSVDDDALPVTRYASSDFVDGHTGGREYTYNGVGALTADLNRGIRLIEYDNLNNPRRLLMDDGDYSEYIYSVDGARLAATHIVEDGIAGERVDYVGPAIYRSGRLEMVRFGGGYATVNGDKTDFHFYVTDYLGNNRAVVNADGTVEQAVAYYAWGATIPDLGFGHALQPYKWGGKELDLNHGLNLYDFIARNYDPLLCTFHAIDRRADKYPWLSPYTYCALNPVNAIDPTGEDIALLSIGGYIGHVALLIEQENGWHYYSFNGDFYYNLTNGIIGGNSFHNMGEKVFDSPQDFLKSNYNQKGTREQRKNDEVCGYDYDKAIVIKTGSLGNDDAAAEKFTKLASNTSYGILSNNCTQVAEQALQAAGVKTTMKTEVKKSVNSAKRKMVEIINTTGLPSWAKRCLQNLFRPNVDDSQKESRTVLPNCLILKVIMLNDDEEIIYK